MDRLEHIIMQIYMEELRQSSTRYRCWTNYLPPDVLIKDRCIRIRVVIERTNHKSLKDLSRRSKSELHVYNRHARLVLYSYEVVEIEIYDSNSNNPR